MKEVTRRLKNDPRCLRHLRPSPSLQRHLTEESRWASRDSSPKGPDVMRKGSGSRLPQQLVFLCWQLLLAGLEVLTSSTMAHLVTSQCPIQLGMDCSQRLNLTLAVLTWAVCILRSSKAQCPQSILQADERTVSLTINFKARTTKNTQKPSEIDCGGTGVLRKTLPFSPSLRVNFGFWVRYRKLD